MNKLIRKYSFYIVCYFLFSQALFAQSLSQDAQKMVTAIDILGPQKLTVTDSVKVDALADLLAILHHYDELLNNKISAAEKFRQLPKLYAKNPLLSPLLVDSLFDYPDAILVAADQLAQIRLNEITQAPRQKILDLLGAKKAISPAEYLSVRRTLKRYVTPSIPLAKPMQLAASRSNRNITESIVNTEAAIIKGLFSVIIEGAKKEVITNYLEQMLQEDAPKIREIFPAVVEQFEYIDIAYSNSFVERVRQAFFEDLQLLSIRLPSLMLDDQYFEVLREDPIAYNLLSIYTITGMVQNGVPIQEVMPVTHNFLYNGYEESEKSLNLAIAKKSFETADYQRLIQLSKSLDAQIDAIYSGLESIENQLLDTIEAFENSFADAPIVTHFLDDASNNLGVILNGKNNKFSLRLLPELLTGELNQDRIVNYSSIESYDNFFGTEISPVEWRATGLDLARKLNGTWYRDETIADLLFDWNQQLIEFDAATQKWLLANRPESATRILEKVTTQRTALKQVIIEELDFWKDSLDNNQKIAFELLATIITPPAAEFGSFDELLGVTDETKINEGKAIIQQVEDRLANLNKRFRKDFKQEQTSPANKYFLSKTEGFSKSFLANRIEVLAKTLEAIAIQIEKIEAQQSNKKKARDNAIPILQITDVVSRLMYNIQSGQADNWLNPGMFRRIENNEPLNNVFNGLMQQSLGKVKNIGFFSATALSQLVNLTIQDYYQLKVDQRVDSLQFDSLKFYKKAAFAVNTLNRILELPLVVDNQAFSQPQNIVGTNPSVPFPALKNQFKQLENVPFISRKTLDFIYFLNIKDHSKAVSSLLSLFSKLNLEANIENLRDSMPEDTLKALKRNKAISFLQKYGGFVADLIDAESNAQVQDLMNSKVAPSGSSKLKRTQSVTVGLNAYVGGALGGEIWKGGTLSENDKDEFFRVAPTIPVGVTISKLVGKKDKQSFSAFISLIDLGGFFNYRINADAGKVGDSDFNFQNIFRPGLQVHWNLKDSPFYLGAGVQYGPQSRQVGTNDVLLNTVRYFVGAGIDVPLLVFYQDFE